MSADPNESDMAQRVRQVLYRRPELRGVTVHAVYGTVTLEGTVASFYEKQLCISGSQRVAGVLRLVDNLVVADSPSRLQLAS